MIMTSCVHKNKHYMATDTQLVKLIMDTTHKTMRQFLIIVHKTIM